jgi:hypothetical protein
MLSSHSILWLISWSSRCCLRWAIFSFLIILPFSGCLSLHHHNDRKHSSPVDSTRQAKAWLANASPSNRNRCLFWAIAYADGQCAFDANASSAEIYWKGGMLFRVSKIWVLFGWAFVGGFFDVICLERLNKRCCVNIGLFEILFVFSQSFYSLPMMFGSNLKRREGSRGLDDAFGGC